MGIELVQWKRITNFTGRNGYCKCSGIELMNWDHNKSVNLAALTSKGMVGRMDIEIPVEALPDLIAKLQSYLPTMDVPELIRRADAGSTDALDTLEELSGSLSHDANCSYRHKGECDCPKNDITQALDRHERQPA